MSVAVSAQSDGDSDDLEDIVGREILKNLGEFKEGKGDEQRECQE